MKLLKYSGYTLLAILLLVLLTVAFLFLRWQLISLANLRQLGEEAATLTEGGHTYRDLNKNGKLDSYEDNRATIEHRIEDLLDQMTLEEKAGTMFITIIGMNEDGSLNEVPSPSAPFAALLGGNSTLVVKKKMNHFNTVQASSAQAMATWNNNIQKLAERTRLGIPVTVATDPRHVASNNIGAGIFTPFFSKWPSPLGLAAIGDTGIVQEFGDIARQEYTALGMRLALSPMADLATEPRWGRINGTFGEDAILSAQLTHAYVQGLQGDSLTATSVACMTKHFPGGGPQKDGEDAHFPYGAEQVYPGNNFDYHLIPFEEGAFAANTAQIMPYYGLPVGQTTEAVAFGYNREIITELLREEYGFNGVVCTDWGLVTDTGFPGVILKPASAHGVEQLSETERVAKILEAGCDMLGGESNPEWIVELVNSGKVSEDRIDTSVRRILRDKFRLGLFDNPYVDADDLSIIGNPTFLEKGKEAQRKSLVLLKNGQDILPLQKKAKVFVKGMKPEAVQLYATIVENPEEADYIILKLNTPFDQRSDYLLEQFFHQGRLDFPEEEKAAILALIRSKPTVTVLNIERPAIIPVINQATQALIADFDCADEIITELIFGQFSPSGKLPLELPSSVQAVENQQEDVPYDSDQPLYPFGYGITF
ncbi:MAG: glycoside hydrolase family 3 N-terminal domain-containing protein [Bacteroidota bacterium]